MRILRWIFFLPVSVICGYLAYLVGGTLNNLSITLFIGSPATGWMRVGTDVLAHIYMGAASAYVAVKVAPEHPKLIALGIFALQLIFASASIWSSFVIGKYYAIPAILGLVFGGIAVLIATLAGEIRCHGDVGVENA